MSENKICLNCHQITTRLYDGLCNKCEADQTTRRKRELQLEKILPKLYWCARLDHLAQELREIILSLPKDRGLTLWGAPGVGKTYAMAALIREFVLEGYSVKRFSYDLLSLKIRDTFKNGSDQSEAKIIQDLVKSDKLFLEDLGSATKYGKPESEFVTRTLLLLLDQRIESQLPTFITTNKPLEELERSFDCRIASRLLLNEIVQIRGDDRRIARNSQKGTGISV